MSEPLEAADFMEEAESAERANAWPQAAALWRRAAGMCRDDQAASCREGLQRCEFEIHTDAELASIARRILEIPTLENRGSDHLDVHQIAVWQLREALRLAHQHGRSAVVR
ncbi:MAG: DUF6900 domain-containing protein [Planctomycetaceae bacterium]|jgi:hypothetical protein